jgi:acetolactate synthase-1/2/3 large subunit
VSETYVGAQLIVETLERLGTTDVFTLCGNHILPLQEASRTSGLQMWPMRSESAAVMAADAYGRISRRVAVTTVTGGSGMATTTSALLTALGNRSPLVVISGAGDQVADGRGAQQEADHLAIAASVVKWQRVVRQTEHIVESLHDAFKIAASGRPGPVHLTIPLDVQEADASHLPPAVTAPQIASPVPPPEFVARAAEIIRRSSRPVIIAGASAWQSAGEAALTRIVADTSIPLFTLDSARGIVPDTSASVFGSADPSINKTAQLLTEADVVLVLGRTIDFRLRLGAALAAEAEIVHVDPDLEALGRNTSAALACAADPAGFAALLADRISGYAAPAEWLSRLAEAQARSQAWLAAAADSDTAGDGLHPASIALALNDIGNDHDLIYALDCGEFVQWCRQAIRLPQAGRWLRLGPQSTCGAGLPFGIGARVARPDLPVLVIAGDGGIGYHLAELETATRTGLPLVVVVGHDAGWGIERNLQRGIYGADSVFTTDLGRVDLVRAAQGCGADGLRVHTVGELDKAVRGAIAAGNTTLIEVPVRTIPSELTRAMIERRRH